ncbi:MAG: hypothetical protein K6A70_08155 [Erysipelotrichaceae bacterium]|nr:hypothetical protein [Erysipelotrichaceae bacterium]
MNKKNSIIAICGIYAFLMTIPVFYFVGLKTGFMPGDPIQHLVSNEDHIIGVSLITDEEYKAAGVELVFANWFGNWGYKFQGVEIDLKKANALVKFYKDFGRPAESITECYRYYRNEMDSI